MQRIHNLARPRLSLLLLACLLLAATSRLAKAQSYYTIIDLGTLGGSGSVPYRVNNFGEVTGYSSTASGTSDAFLYSDGGMYDLGVLSGFASSAGLDINDFGQVVGLLRYGGGPEGKDHAFLFSNGVMQDLGTPAGFTYSQATGINDSGQIAGNGINTPGWPPTDSHAALYSNSTWFDLGTLGGQWSYAEVSINSFGQISGASATANGDTHAFLWTPNVPNGVTGTMIDLGTLGGNYSFAVSINDTGQVSGWSTRSDGSSHYFLWTPNVPNGVTGMMIDLGTLGGMDNWAGAGGINSLGQVVGSVAGGGYALLFTGGNIINLGNCIPGNSGWSMVYASSVSVTGYISGQGVINGQYHAYLMTPNFHLHTLSLSPSTQAGSLNIIGKLTLNQAAPFDLAVSLTNSNLAAIAPTTVIIPAGTTSKTFTIKTYPVSGAYTGFLTAEYYGVTLAKAFTVRPIGVKSVMLNATSVTGGATVSGTVALEAKAAPGPITVSFVSTNHAVAPDPPSITIPAGSTAGTFTVSTVAGSSGSTTIKATANGITKTSKTLTVTP